MRDNLSDTLSRVADDEPVTIRKNNKDVAVLISKKRFRDMKRIEDMLYVKMAEMAEEEGFVSDKEARDIMTKLGADE